MRALWKMDRRRGEEEERRAGGASICLFYDCCASFFFFSAFIACRKTFCSRKRPWPSFLASSFQATCVDWS